MLISPDLLPPIAHKPVVWKEFGAYLDKKVAVAPPPSSLPRRVPQTPGVSLLATAVPYKVCTSCQRPIGAASLDSHYQRCVEMRQKLKDETGETPVPAATAAVQALKRKRGRPVEEPLLVDLTRTLTPQPNGPVETKPKKKYKKLMAQREKEGKKKEQKKKQQAKPKAAAAKAKGPVDVETHCGVPLPSGGHCARSLTCKTHLMGAKRAVPGRLAPYDVLLQQYQKRNKAKMAASNALAVQQRENAELRDDDVFATRVLDPDEETQLVLEGLSKNNPIPLERNVIMPLRSRHRFLAMREAYANALIILANNSAQKLAQTDANALDQTLANQAILGSIGGLQGRCALINVDQTLEQTQAYLLIPGEVYQVRAPSKAISMTAHVNQLQQQAFQQQLQRYQQQQQQLLAHRQQQAQK